MYKTLLRAFNIQQWINTTVKFLKKVLSGTIYSDIKEGKVELFLNMDGIK